MIAKIKVNKNEVVTLIVQSNIDPNSQSQYQRPLVSPQYYQMQSKSDSQDASNYQAQNMNNQNPTEDEEELVLSKISEDYCESANHDKLFALVKGKRGSRYFKMYANFSIVSLRKEIYVDRNSDKMKYMKILLLSSEGYKKEIKIPYEGWTSHLMKVIEREAPGFIIYSDKFRNATAMFKRICEEIQKKLLEEGKIITQYIYLDWGWGERLKDGSRIFYDGSMTNCLSKKCLLSMNPDTNQHQKNLAYGYSTILTLAPSETILPIVNYILSSQMDVIYRDANNSFAIRSTLFLVGDSGIGKSTGSAALCNVCAPEEDRLISVRSTKPATEEMVR